MLKSRTTVKIPYDGTDPTQSTTSDVQTTTTEPSVQQNSGNQNKTIEIENQDENTSIIKFKNDLKPGQLQSDTIKFRVSAEIRYKEQITVNAVSLSAKTSNNSDEESTTQATEVSNEYDIDNGVSFYVAPEEYYDARLSNIQLTYSTQAETDIVAVLSPDFSSDTNKFTITIRDGDISGKYGSRGETKSYTVYIQLLPKNADINHYNDYQTKKGKSYKGIMYTKPLIINNGTLLIDDSSELRNNCIFSPDALSAGAVNNHGQMTVKGKITGNSAKGNKNCVGAVYNKKGYELTISGKAQISNNFGEYCGGILNEGTLNMNSGIIEKNSASDGVGGVENTNDFNLSGGEIVYNTASSGIGGVKDESGSGLIISGSPLICNNTADYLNSNLCVSKNCRVGNIKNAAIGIVNSDKSDAFAVYEGANEDSKANCRNCFFADNSPFKKIEFSDKNELFFSPDEFDTYYKLIVSCKKNSSWEIDSFQGERMLGTSQSLTITVSLKVNLSDPAPEQKPVVKIYKYDDFIDGTKNPVSDDFEKLENGKYVYTIKELKADTVYEIVIE